MYISNTILGLHICISFVSPIVFGKLLFTVTNWNACLPDVLKLKTITGLALRACVAECSKRRSCEYIGYLRNVHLCQLYTELGPTSQLEEGACLVISKGDIDNSMFPDDCTCEVRKVCNVGICEYRECSQLAFTNGYVVGNRNDVGSRQIIYCESGYTQVNGHMSVTCGTSGNWSYVPACISTTVCGDMTVENGDLIGQGNGVGAVRTIICDTGYEEQLGERSVQCESTGSWNYIPTCSLIIVCGDITVLDGDLIGTGNEVGAVRTIVCNTGFEEISGKTSIVCDSTGNWNYIPVCNIACPSSTGHFRDGLHIKIHTAESVKQNDADSRCSADGGKLVKIDEIWKIDFINEILASCSEYDKHSDYWTDGKTVNGIWKFEDNTVVPLTEHVYWAKDKPDKYSDDKCARLEKTGSVFLWDDIKCKTKYRYICEY